MDGFFSAGKHLYYSPASGMDSSKIINTIYIYDKDGLL